MTVAVGDEQKRDIVHRSVEEHVDDDEEPASPVSKAREKFVRWVARRREEGKVCVCVCVWTGAFCFAPALRPAP